MRNMSIHDDYCGISKEFPVGIDLRVGFCGEIVSKVVDVLS